MMSRRTRLGWLTLLLFYVVTILCGAEHTAADLYPVTPKAFGSDRFRLEVNGQSVFVHKFKDIHYTHFPFPESGNAQIIVTARRAFRTIDLGPKSGNIQFVSDRDSKTLEFRLTHPGKVVATMDESEKLFIFAEKPLAPVPVGISVLDYGADPSGNTLSTLAIQSAIDKAPNGSTVRIPPGHYISGSLFIKSGISLFLEAGALLQASGDPEDFEPIQNAFIVVENAVEVAIKGMGAIDGSGAYLRHLTADGGRLLSIRDSRQVVVEDIILRDPRAWNTHIIRSENVTLRNVKILNDRDVSNTDGIDPDSSSHVLIEDCFFYCGDDAVAIKSTNYMGPAMEVHDITVRNNIMLTHKSALKVGTETHASVMENILFENNQVIECDRGMSLYARDGTHMRNIKFIGNRFEKPYPDYYQRLLHFEIKKRSGLSRISDILVEDCTADQAWPEPSLIKGFSDEHDISNVRFVNYRYGKKVCLSLADADLEAEKHVKNITFESIEQPSFEIVFKEPTEFNMVEIVEPVGTGTRNTTRILAYSIQYWTGNKWQDLEIEYADDRVKIHRFNPVVSTKVRMQIDKCIPGPEVSKFTVNNELRSADASGYQVTIRDEKLPNVLLYGDSISHQYYPYLAEELKGKVNLYTMPPRHDWDSRNFIPAIKGLDRILDRHWKWDLIHFNFGLHDMKRYGADGKKDAAGGVPQVGFDEYAQNLKSGIEWLTTSAPETRLMFATTTPVPEGEPRRRLTDSKKYNDLAKSVLVRFPKVLINDLFAFTDSHDTEWRIKPNDVHYNSTGQKAQGEMVANAILNALAR